MNRVAKSRKSRPRRRWPTLPIVVAGGAAFIALSGSAVAATGLIHSKDIARGAVTSEAIKNGAVKPWDLSTGARDLLQGANGQAGLTGSTGAAGAKGETGPAGNSGSAGAQGVTGKAGADGLDGNDGAKGTDGAKGNDGAKGTDGANGKNGIVTPLSATAGLTQLPTATPPTVVISLTVPAANYVVLAKTQLFHTGAGDSVECVLKAGATVIDRVAMKTHPALASIPVSMQAVTTTEPSQLSVECDVTTANGTADVSSLIAIPIG